MIIRTNRGQTFDVNWAWVPRDTNRLMIELNDARSIEEIAQDFDRLTTIERESETEGNKVYIGYEKLIGVVCDPDKGTVQLTMVKRKEG